MALALALIMSQQSARRIMNADEILFPSCFFRSIRFLFTSLVFKETVGIDGNLAVHCLICRLTVVESARNWN